MSSIKYRPEIDGLRSFAVLPVLVYHMHIGLLSGGFVGVDIFFVISGYLITSILIKEIDGGIFSILGFYERRARRILPALLFMILVCAPFSYILMLPYQIIDFSESVIAAILFFSNFHFMMEGGYFAGPSAFKPLLHTWSLSVEEQFYIVFPIFLAFFWRFNIKTILIIMAATFLFSVVGAEIGAGFSSTMNFFFTPSRAFELLAGCFVAFALRRGPLKRSALSEGLALLGAGAIIISYAILGHWGNVPGFGALLPTLGATLVILFAQRGTLVARFLSLRPIVFIGLISYSLYLWHWPIFVFARLAMGETPSPLVATGLAALSFAAATLSWRYIERPFRDPHRFGRGAIFRGSLIGAAGLGALAVVGLTERGFVNRYPPQDRQLAAMKPSEIGDIYTRRAFKQFEGAEFDEDPHTPNVLVIGDSYAMDYMNMAQAIGELDRASYSTRHIHAYCGIVFTEKPIEQNFLPKERAECQRTMPVFDNNILDRAAHADKIVLAASWRPWVVDLLPETLDKLRTYTNAKILIVGTKFFSNGPVLRELLTMQPEERALLRQPIPINRVLLNQKMREMFYEDDFIDFFGSICENDAYCPILTPDNMLISFDGVHLTLEGARYLGQKFAPWITSSGQSELGEKEQVQAPTAMSQRRASVGHLEEPVEDHSGSR